MTSSTPLTPKGAHAGCGGTRSRATWCAKHAVTPNDLIYPVFVLDGQKQRQSVAIDAGVERLSLDLLPAGRGNSA
jgi:delta-aminolevulinic acid dehydratase/porphobilinogen synthase